MEALIKLVFVTAIGLAADFLGGLFLYWFAGYTGVEALSGLTYWNYFWISFLFTTLVSFAINVHEVVKELE